MYSIAGRTALRTARPSVLRYTRPRFAHSATAEDKEASTDALKKGAKRDPELYILLAIMSGVFGLAGWHFSGSPTGSSSERTVAKIPGSEAWKTGRSSIYQYHPGGDTSQPKKDAPSTLSVVIVPAVSLPKELHEKYNKYGKPGYDY